MLERTVGGAFVEAFIDVEALLPTVKHVSAPFLGVLNVVSAPFNIYA